MSTTKTVAEKIKAGDYKNKLPYSLPGMPKDEREKMTKAWYAEEGRLRDLFQADLAAEHGVTGNPKEPLLFRLTWEEGHSCGYSEVAIYYDDFVELIK